MASLESIQKSIGTAEELQSVVKSMKALAAASIRRFEQAVEALQEYARTTELSVEMLAAVHPEVAVAVEAEEPAMRYAAIVFGADQGMSGRFNQQVVAHAIEHFDAMDIAPENRTVWIVGSRVLPLLEGENIAVHHQFTPASALEGITTLVRRVLVQIQQWRDEGGISPVYVYHNRPTGGASFAPDCVQLVPLGKAWMDKRSENARKIKRIPLLTMPAPKLLADLLRELLYTRIYRAAAESLASENASRLAAMQSAQRNIDERLGQLQSTYRQVRQASITEELLDISAGFEALKNPR